jgi:hypothetical protein
MRRFFKAYWIPLVLCAVSVLVGIAPIISVVIAGTLANMYGCELHEGFVNPCVILGADRGELLYAMGVLGWFGLMTLPIGAIGVGLSLVVGVIIFFARWRAKS